MGMKNVKKILIFCAVIFWVTSAEAAYSNEKDGFRKYQWGMSVEAVRNIAGENLKLFKSIGRYGVSNDVYIIHEDDNIVGGIKFINPIKMKFYNNKLYQVVIPIIKDGANDDHSLSKEVDLAIVLFNLHGKVQKSSSEEMNGVYRETKMWFGDRTDLDYIRTKTANLIDLDVYLTDKILLASLIKDEDEQRLNFLKRGW